MELDRVKEILGILALKNLCGDKLRITLYIASIGQCRLEDIEKALGLRKSTVSRYCKQLYHQKLLKRYNNVITLSSGKRVVPYYSFNWEVNANEWNILHTNRNFY